MRQLQDYEGTQVYLNFHFELAAEYIVVMITYILIL